MLTRNWRNENLIAKTDSRPAFCIDQGVRRQRRGPGRRAAGIRIGGSVPNLRRRTSLSSLQAKAAQLGFGLVCNHPFVDGNKRIGAHAMLVFLAVNGIELCYEQQELIDVILAVASGETDRQGLLQWILDHE